MNRPSTFTRITVMIILGTVMLMGITVGAIPIYNMEMTECHEGSWLCLGCGKFDTESY